MWMTTMMLESQARQMIRRLEIAFVRALLVLAVIVRDFMPR